MTITYKVNFETIAKLAGVALGFAIPISNVLTNICVAILLLAWCCSGIRQKVQLIFTSKITWAILGLLVVYVVGSIYSPADAAQIKQMLKKMSRLLLIPVLMSLFTDPKWRRYALDSFWWAIGVSLVCIVGKLLVNPANISALLTKWHLATSSRWLAYPTITFKDRIFTSLFFSFAIFSLLHYSVAKNNVYSLCKPCRLLYFSLALLCFAYLELYCDGRSGQVISIGLIIIFLLQQNFGYKKTIFYSVLLLTIIAGALFLSPSNRDRYVLTIQEVKAYIAQEKIAPLHQQSTGLRAEFLTKSLKLAKTAPWFGLGTGSFRAAYNKQHPLYDNNNQQLPVHNPHNQYVLTLVELGSMGLLALLGMFFIMLYESTFLPKLEKYLMQGVIFSIMVGCTANSWLMDFASMHYFVYFIGVLLAALPANVYILSSTGQRQKITN